jgi:acyl carrier protein
MQDLKSRLIRCFQTVFPQLSEAQVLTATPATVPSWDSMAAITLVNLVEEEFGLELDYDILAELNSFDRVHEFLSRQQ